ncbi:MAG: hypothetical protein ACREMF_02885 [Gemmatimonadales bacterium]
MAPSHRTAALNRMHIAVKELTDQLDAVGTESPEGLEDLKSAVDDVRLRLWGVLMAATTPGDRGFGERFRLRRAAEILCGIMTDAEAGRLSLTHSEGGELGVVSRELGRRITAAHTTG